MMKPRTSKLLAAVLLATSSSSSMKGVEGKPNTLSKPLKPNGKPTPVTTTTEEEEVYTPIDLSALADSVETTTTTSSTRTAAWGTMAATTTTTTTTTKAVPTTEPTAEPTVGPTTSPSAAPTPVPTTLTPSLSPTKRIMRKADILPLCQPSLTIATTFDIDNSSALNQHEFSQFIESTTGSSAATVILTSASDQLYQELRKGCVKVFKMPESCYDETTTSDDDDVTSATTALDNKHNNGKFDTLEDSTYVHDGVMLVGFHKGWESKEKVEKKYEEFFCKKLMEFYVENDVELDWTLVDGPSLPLPVVVVEEEEEVVVIVEEEDGNSTMIDDLEASSATNNSTVDTFNITDMEVFNDTDIVFNNTEVDSNNTDVMDWSAIANLVVEAAEAAEAAETTTAASTTTASTTTTISAEAVQEEEEEEEENATNNNTASGINAADTSFIQAINQQQQSDSSSPSLDKIPLGGWIGIGLGGVLFVFLLVALLVSKKRRHNNSRNANAVVVENNNNNNDDNDSIWSDDDYEVTNMNMMMQGAGKGSSSSSSPMSGVAAIGMASTVATRLTTGDTEVTLMKKQVWTEREPVV